MNEVLEPAGIARRLLLRRVIGTGIVIVIGSRMAVAADAQVVIDTWFALSRRDRILWLPFPGPPIGGQCSLMAGR